MLEGQSRSCRASLLYDLKILSSATENKRNKQIAMKLNVAASSLGGTGVNEACKPVCAEHCRERRPGQAGTHVLQAPCTQEVRGSGGLLCPRCKPRPHGPSAHAALPGTRSLCLCPAASAHSLPNSALAPGPHDPHNGPPERRVVGWWEQGDGSGAAGSPPKLHPSSGRYLPLSVFSLLFVLAVKLM